MIETISSKLAIYLLGKIEADDYDTEYEILEYGIECIINMLIPILFYTAFAIYNRFLIEMLVWIFCLLFYRNLIGRYHAHSHIKCIIQSTVFGLVSLYVATLDYIVDMQNTKIILCVLLIIHLFVKPIIHHSEKNNITFIKQRKVLVFLTLFVAGLLISLSGKALPSISNSVFVGIISAEILYLIAVIQKRMKMKTT